ncbi:MATE family efflux transporter [Eubacterium multiforme]|uniref:Probable multidrug resistance protein NorM n=1 Tax=Eubacterium multiforme TaxID=83339 RepID=A0ABT9UNH1_9FIRM|nr:MATE family efflux transporter [Eubacterium multiforme]MDQ0148195.1 putative MATE family efflux protein [Eubacterium multiforme]
MEKIDLTKGDITKSLLKLSLPIIATNFIQMAYGMIDMIWIGRVGSGAVAAIGTASFFINLAMALFTLIVIGTGVKISHAIGRGEEKEGQDYIANGFILSITLAILYTIFIFIFKDKLIGFYELSDITVEKMAENYLVISAVGIIFMYFNSLLTTIFNSYGESKMPFRANTVGFIFNIILDPVLIFGLGPIKPLGVFGAALATLIARIIVFTMFLRISKGRLSFLRKGIKLNIKKAKEVMQMGLPITAQRVIFTLIAITIAKIVANWGATAIAVQKVGVQIESISYITIGGLQGAIAAFVGQNYGAKKEERIKRGYYKALKLTVIFGLLVTLTFFIFSRQIFGIFLSENEALNMGSIYMKILGLSQVFMCMELLTVGAFNGLGKTYAPPIVSIIFSGLRIPMAIFLSSGNLFGLNGVWMSISVSSLFKGTILVTWFLIELKRLKLDI